MKILNIISITIILLIWSVISRAQCGWELQNTDQLTNSELTSVFFVDSLNGWTVGGNPGIIARTIDGGENWTEVYNNEGCFVYDVYFLNNSKGWAVGGQSDYSSLDPGVILQSDNGGLTWDSIYHGFNNVFSVHFFNENTGLVAGQNKILLTTDGGNSWQYTNTGIDTTIFTYIYSKIQFLDNETGFVKTLRMGIPWVGPSDNFILKTSDGGNTWDSIPDPDHTFVSGGLEDYFFIDENIGWATTFGIDINNFEHSLIDKTIDGGVNWSTVLSSDYYKYYGVHFVDEIRGWVLGEWLYTEDSGQSWTSYINPECGMYSYSGHDIFFLNEYKGWIVGYGSQIWTTDSGGLVTGVETQKKEENKLLSFVVYPNPFSNQTTIKFSLNELENISISIYDITGKKLETIFADKLSPSDHQITWKTINLSPGIYYIRMDTNNQHSVHKVIISG